MDRNPEAPNLRPEWGLDPQVVFLNHGSFGACPLVVLQEQARLRTELEKEPIRFFTKVLEPLCDQARLRLADFVDCDAQDLVFIPNATWGVNTVLRSLEFNRGDQILITNHTYNACANAARYIADRQGAEVVTVQIGLPVATPSDVVDAVLRAVTPRTRLALLDHVTSPTSLVMPIGELVARLSARGVETLVDGAHAPGMVPVELAALNPTYYTANCHKWLCAPKGAGFLFVQRHRQRDIRPLAVSHGANSPRRDRSRYLLEFDWTGTHDPSPYLCVPAALDFLASLFPGGWSEIFTRHQRAALDARQLLCRQLSAAPICPDAMVGAMFTLELPGPAAHGLDPRRVELLHDRLIDAYRVQVLINDFAGRLCCRVSCMLYNDRQDIQSLADALQAVLESSQKSSFPDSG